MLHWMQCNQVKVFSLFSSLFVIVISSLYVVYNINERKRRKSESMQPAPLFPLYWGFPPLGKIVQRNKHHASMDHCWGRSGKDGARVSVTECPTPQ